MDDNGIKVKTLEHTASCKNSFKWWIKDDKLLYDATHILTSISNFPNLLRYNFTKDEMFEEETLSSKNSAEFKDFTMPKCTSSGFFCQSNFVLKEF